MFSFNHGRILFYCYLHKSAYKSINERESFFLIFSNKYQHEILQYANIAFNLASLKNDYSM